MAAVAILIESQKSRYPRKGLTDLCEILLTAKTVKIFDFCKSLMVDGRHFENR